MKCKNYEDFCALFERVSDMIARLDYGGSVVDLTGLRKYLDALAQANPVFMRQYLGLEFRTTNDCPDYLRS